MPSLPLPFPNYVRWRDELAVSGLDPMREAMGPVMDPVMDPPMERPSEDGEIIEMHVVEPSPVRR